MHSFLKISCVLVMLLAAVFSALVWFDDRPSNTIWVLRFVLPATAVFALALVLKLHFKRGLAPDFLLVHSGDYYNRRGLCFMPDIDVVDGIAHFKIWFQNQYQNPCFGRITLLAHPEIDTSGIVTNDFVFDVECESGAFGVVSIPVSIPKKFQGECLVFDIGATVKYQGSKGRQLRFRDGIIIHKNSNLKDIVGTASSVVQVFIGFGFWDWILMLFSKPGHVKLRLPRGCEEKLPDTAIPIVKTYWKLGDDVALEW